MIRLRLVIQEAPLQRRDRAAGWVSFDQWHVFFSSALVHWRSAISALVLSRRNRQCWNNI